MADATQDEDTAMRFEALRWHVQTVDGHDMAAFAAALAKTKEVTGKPHLIIAKTLIGKGIPEVAGTAKAHGEGGAKFIDGARKALGLPEEHFFVSPETRAYFEKMKTQRASEKKAWDEKFAAWKSSNADLAKMLEEGMANKVDGMGLLAKIPEFPGDAKIATRKAGSDVLQPIAEQMPMLVGGSADLYGGLTSLRGRITCSNRLDVFHPQVPPSTTSTPPKTGPPPTTLAATSASASANTPCAPS
jgi:transketolase